MNLTEKIVQLVAVWGLREGDEDKLRAETLLCLLEAARITWRDCSATRAEVHRWAHEELGCPLGGSAGRRQ